MDGYSGSVKILALWLKNERRHKKAYALFFGRQSRIKLKLLSYRRQISTQDGWVSAADALQKVNGLRSV